MRPMISIAATTGLFEAITAAGGNPDHILRTIGLDRSAFSNPEGFIASASFARLLEEAARATADDCFGLHFGERSNPKNLGPAIYVFLNSPTIEAGIVNVERYLHVFNQAAKWFFTVEGDRGYIRFLLTDLGIEAPRQHNECSMTVALNTLRIMVGSQWTPQEVQFAHQAPGQIAEHHRVFGAPVSFGCETNAFVVEREFVEREVPAADPRLYRILKRYLESVLNEMPQEDSLLASVRKSIAESMRDGDPKLATGVKESSDEPAHATKAAEGIWC